MYHLLAEVVKLCSCIFVIHKAKNTKLMQDIDLPCRMLGTRQALLIVALLAVRVQSGPWCLKQTKRRWPKSSSLLRCLQKSIQVECTDSMAGSRTREVGSMYAILSQRKLRSSPTICESHELLL